jgi:hypothetical protein
MGLKSGSEETGIDRSDTDESDEQEGDPVDDDSNGISYDELPYLLQRDSVNADRKQISFFIRGELLNSEDEYEETLEEILGEEVYRSDAREAAIVLAHRNPELVADILREWGYDLD